MAHEAADAAARGAGTSVVLLGAAGTGKSRLLDEARARAHDSGVRVLRGRVTESAAATPFGPFAEAVAAAFRSGWPADPALLPVRGCSDGWPARTPAGGVAPSPLALAPRRCCGCCTPRRWPGACSRSSPMSIRGCRGTGAGSPPPCRRSTHSPEWVRGRPNRGRRTAVPRCAARWRRHTLAPDTPTSPRRAGGARWNPPWASRSRPAPTPTSSPRIGRCRTPA
ncbi:AAA family ATPase [Pseudonocardia asaccharolytica]|uniref:AAA family ATPase n=1 Tax=Pseudonocardia asaccharolytica TaxID=54010 RepID=UPI0035A24E1C